jgi:hypothetical protein
MSVRFTSTKLVNSNKKGILSPDANGYYEIILGGLNTFNSAGEYYVLEGAKQLFESSSIFMRRVKSGCLKSELGHPKQLPGMSSDQYLQRILTIEETNVIAHISEIWLDESFGKKNPSFNNPSLVAIMGKVKPAGPHANVLKEALANGQEDVCFSIRALTQDYYDRGQTYRILKQIVSFDQVGESGLSLARKYHAPGLESVSETIVTTKALERVITSKTSSVSTEDSKNIAVACLESIKTNVPKSIEKPFVNKW